MKMRLEVPIWLHMTLSMIAFGAMVVAGLLLAIAFMGLLYGATVWFFTGEYPLTHPWMTGAEERSR